MTKFRLTTSFRRGAALALVLGSAIATNAYAGDPLLGSPQEEVIMQSARSAHGTVAGASIVLAGDPLLGSPQEELIMQSARSTTYADPQQTPLAVATAKARALANPVASNASSSGLSRDLVGQHGMQDEIGREIFRPGTYVGPGG